MDVMLTKVFNSNRGIAVLITLSVITVMITAALQLNRKMLTAAESSATDRDRLVLAQMATSGVHTAMAMLIQDKADSKADSLQEDWADPDKVAEMMGEIPFENGKVTVLITDEMAKLQINALVDFPEGRHYKTKQKQLWERFANRLVSFYEDVDPTEVKVILDSIKDWLDSGDDDATEFNGAESSYYEGLETPYACKNGPFTHIGEVALVKGISPEIFHGFGELMGLANYITIYGIEAVEQKIRGNGFTYPGKVNINTADLPVLAALLPEDTESFAQALYDYRLEKEEDTYLRDLTKENWYKEVPGFAGIDIDPALITTSSEIFRIQSTAERNDVKMTLVAVIKRIQEKKTGKWRCKVLNWQAG
jgi:general secretion pathway protein K